MICFVFFFQHLILIFLFIRLAITQGARLHLSFMIDSSASSNVFFSLETIFCFYFSYYTLQFKQFHVEFVYAHLFIGILSLVSIALILCFSCLCVVFFHYFNIVLVLKSLSHCHSIWTSWIQVMLSAFFLYIVHSFLGFLHLII